MAESSSVDDYQHKKEAPIPTAGEAASISTISPTTSLYSNSHGIAAAEPIPVQGFQNAPISAPEDAEKGLTREETRQSVLEMPESIFKNKWEIYFLVVLGALGQIVSSINVPIFFPTLETLAAYFGESVSMINLSATMYSLFQGLSPLVWGSFSDSFGRRPAYIGCAMIAVAANVALACAKNYWTLFGVRIVQAFGSASTVPMTGALVGDFTQRKNRGSLMAVANGLGLLGNCFGPLIGGGLIARWNWRAIFWFLAIYDGCFLLIIALALPETHRMLVGIGNKMPQRWANRSPYMYLRHHVTGIPYLPSQPEWKNQWTLPYRKPRYFAWASLLCEADVLLVLVPLALHYTTWYMIMTMQSTILETSYGLSVEKVGFTYLSSGVGTVVASFLTASLIQKSYRRETARGKAECEAKGVKFHQSSLNIFVARLEFSLYASLLMVASSVVFGWTIQREVSFYVPVVMTFFVAGSATYFLSCISTLLVDLFPKDSGAASSLHNMARCCLCAAGLAAVDKMQTKMGAGGTATLMAGLCALSCTNIFILMRFGPGIVDRRNARLKAKLMATESQAVAKQ